MPPASRPQYYLLSLGSNRPRAARLGPAALLKEATARIGERVGPIRAASPIIATAPIGPSRRRFVNAALLIESALAPDALLRTLQAIEATLGRQRHQRWGARRIDIDIILWSGGAWRLRGLTIPHMAFRQRAFVLEPARVIAPDWRDPASGLTVRHLHARLANAERRKVDPGGGPL